MIGEVTVERTTGKNLHDSNPFYVSTDQGPLSATTIDS